MRSSTAGAATEPPANAPSVFDVCGPLPTGTTVLEASAGTGKTFTIAALAARYVAEGAAELSELMLVTFGRAATSELRDRVRERLVTAERALRRPDARESADAVVRHLAAVDDAELELRRRRLTRALSEFDAATIATTHGFCQQMLTSLGVAGDVDADAVLVPDIADLVDEVVDDLYLQRYSGTPAPMLTEADARRVARAAVSDHQAALEPADAAPDSLAGHRYAFALDVVTEVRHRKRVRRLLDYDDLLVLLKEALTDPEHGVAAAQRVRARYRIVMVDEFQDTDPVQWEILRAAFHGHRTLVLIGDPKQAIYAFRGGDVVTYLSAADAADTTSTLGRSWRSDEPLLRGLDRVFRRAALGDERIVVHPVEAEHRGRRLSGAAPLRIRQVTRQPFGLKGTRTPPVDEVRGLISDDVAADVVRQLGSTRLRDRHGWRELRPGDIAVLTRRNADAARVRDALVARGVPAVESGLSSVFASSAARTWLTLLLALEQPGHAGRTATLALTPFVGLDAEALATATDAERDDLADRVRAWSRVLTERGVAALFEAVTAEGLAERLLRTQVGERRLTDLRHIGQALHLVSVQDRLGPAALTDWLRRRMDEAADDYAEERSRRLETDRAAVQVVTIHASKGLEFPVVYVPFSWDRYESVTPPVLTLHDKADQRLVHVGGPESPDYGGYRDQHLVEERGEDLRLLYVALTRAASQVVTWWAPSRNSACGPLSRLLLGEYGTGEQPPAKVSVARDDVVAARLRSLADGSDGSDGSDAVIALETVTALPPVERWEGPAPAQPGLTVGTLGRRLDLTWRRTSYTALAAPAYDAAYQVATASSFDSVPGVGSGVGSEPETTGVDDEWGDAFPGTSRATPDHPLRGIASPMASLPGGAAFGTLVHGVLERVDTGAADLGAELLARCREAVTAKVPGVDAADLAAALGPVLATPLGPVAGGRALRDFARRDRLSELEFELPLAGGDGDGVEAAGASASTLADIAHLLRTHLPDGDPFAAYPDRLAAPALKDSPLRGYLAGSLDAVLRVEGAGTDDGRDSARDGATQDGTSHPTYVVVDYKTNRLAPETEALTAWHYRPAAMADAMMHSHYPLQLLLYLVALHRFLRWRQPGYDPDRHLGGGLYLFVRGMCGPSTPVVDGTPWGVMPWRPATGLVTELSALLEGRSA